NYTLLIELLRILLLRTLLLMRKREEKQPQRKQDWLSSEITANGFEQQFKTICRELFIYISSPAN
ncbi:MAG: hypothetical protein LUD19_00915, partial [Clostridia bacterium]|nr:hypothetical protein [Clostridia bacterium]